MDKLLLRPIEAADLLQVSRSKIYEWISRGVVPSIQLDPGQGRLMRIAYKALQKLAGADRGIACSRD